MHDRVENVGCIHPVSYNYEFEYQNKSDHDDANRLILKLISEKFL